MDRIPYYSEKALVKRHYFLIEEDLKLARIDTIQWFIASFSKDFYIVQCTWYKDYFKGQ